METAIAGAEEELSGFLVIVETVIRKVTDDGIEDHPVPCDLKTFLLCGCKFLQCIVIATHWTFCGAGRGEFSELAELVWRDLHRHRGRNAQQRSGVHPAAATDHPRRQNDGGAQVVQSRQYRAFNRNLMQSNQMALTIHPVGQVAWVDIRVLSYTTECRVVRRKSSLTESLNCIVINE